MEWPAPRKKWNEAAGKRSCMLRMPSSPSRSTTVLPGPGSSCTHTRACEMSQWRAHAKNSTQGVNKYSHMVGTHPHRRHELRMAGSLLELPARPMHRCHHHLPVLSHALDAVQQDLDADTYNCIQGAEPRAWSKDLCRAEDSRSNKERTDITPDSLRSSRKCAHTFIAPPFYAL